MIKLVLTDLDGTFLNSKGDFDHEYYRKVRDLMKKENVFFAPCTVKQCERVEELFENDGFRNIWILGDSATRIKHDGDYIYESLLPNDVGALIIKELEKIASDHVIIACTPTAAMIQSTVPEEEAKKIRRSYAVVKTVETFQEIKEDFVKITVYDPKLRCLENVKKLDQFTDRAYMVASEAAWIDISNHGVHKGTTVQELQKILGVTKEETMAFGDGLNDIELMESAKYSFAMSNAFDQIKEVAAFVTKSNDENGVLKTIESILEIQGKQKNG
ncbi:HAD-IIB family hydrolase [Enterococcus massiliensis]|uniref:HAD-IIB family hydrolase n=1 Tax=Enterococcus massiliensis TaxID=1640685 RepID=UPI00065E799F|nr:HAD-IIB family hydrolase [Enterococcus massiliensis]